MSAEQFHPVFCKTCTEVRAHWQSLLSQHKNVHMNVVMHFMRSVCPVQLCAYRPEVAACVCLILITEHQAAKENRTTSLGKLAYECERLRNSQAFAEFSQAYDPL